MTDCAKRKTSGITGFYLSWLSEYSSWAENYGGPAVTAGGLVFCSGTRDLKIRAFDAATGEELWEHKLPFNGSAAPSVFEANGKQYIVIPATGGGKLRLPQGDAYVAFALPE